MIFMFPCILTQYTEMTKKMQLCRIIYYSLAAPHVSSDHFAHHQDHLDYITASGTTHVCRCRLVSWESLAALHVSSYPFAHHQEHLDCITASGITHVCRCRLVTWESLAALHVSSDPFAHHQEHLDSFTASGIKHVCRCRLVSWECSLPSYQQTATYVCNIRSCNTV
jgi:hypothetical protein